MLLHNLNAATLAQGGPYGMVQDAAILVEGGRIVWCGPKADAPAYQGPRRDLGGRLVTPGLVDCHTHLVFGGNRAKEFELQLKGVGYEEIARAGGGIISTVRDTRRAGVEELVSAALPRLDALIRVRIHNQ